MTRRHRRLATFSDTRPATLALAAPAAPLVDQQARTISGLAVPYGPVGATSMGRLRFAAGSLTWASPRRVKLLREHDTRDSVGYAVELVELSAAEVDARMTAAGAEPLGLAGLWAVFHVPAGENGDRALAEAENGVRDAFSVGVELDAATFERLRKAATNGGAPVQGAGALRETSLVSVPAFDDARVGSVAAHAELVVASWHTPTEGPTAMCPTCGHHHAAGVACPAPAAPATATATTTPPAAPAATTTPVEPATAAATTTPAPAAAAAAAVTPPPAPAAAAGAALVTGEPSTYRFDGSDSLVIDAARARFDHDAEAAGRMARFNAELAAGNPASVMALAAVMQTADAPEVVNGGQPIRRPDLFRQAVDRGRPLNSRLSAIPLRNATPFVLPIEGEFDGVGDHTEGQAHRAEGTLTLDDSPVVTPKAVSGAFRLSRELLDASNPAIDRIAMRAMLRDYRRDTEARLWAALSAATDAIGGITKVQHLRDQLIDFIDDDTEVGFIAAGKGFVTMLADDVDGDGRPMLPFVNPSNAPGSIRAGYTGATVDGFDVVKASTVTTDRAAIVDPYDVLVGESPVQQFRFEEVEGPGVVKLAIWAYYVAAVLDVTGVRELSTQAEPVA